MTDDWEYPNRMGEKAMHDIVIKIAEVSYQTGLRKVVYRGMIQSSLRNGARNIFDLSYEP
jgi:hypothetical protein